MRPLIYRNPIHLHQSPRFSIFRFPSLSRENKRFPHTAHTRPPYIPRPRHFPFIKASSASDSVNYGGWDDMRLDGDWTDSGESTKLSDFLVSVEIDDKRLVFTFLFGILCAVAISRVRVSTIIVFPASVLIFAVGFSFGFVRGGSSNEFSVNASKRRVKEETFRLISENWKSLEVFFDGFDLKVDDLKNDIQRAIDTKEIDMSDLRNYLNVIESLKLSALNGRRTLKAIIDSVGNSNSAVAENQKSSSKNRKEIGEAGFELLQFVGSLFGDKLVDSKPNKAKEKDTVKQGRLDDLANNQMPVNNSTPRVVDGTRNAFDGDTHKRNSILSQGSSNNGNIAKDSTATLDGDREKKVKVDSQNDDTNSTDMHGNAKRFIDGEEYYYHNDRSQHVNDQNIYWKMDQSDELETVKSNDNLLDSMDFRVSMKHTETEASFVQEQMFRKTSRAYRSSRSRKRSEDEIHRFHSQFREENMNDDLHFKDDQFVPESEVGSSSSSSSSDISDDVVFDRYLTEANNLLKQAKDCIRGRHDEELAEMILYKSAKLLSKAITMKPMSLLAVGQLGNTYLLHGELKLRISRELRTILSGRSRLSVSVKRRILKDVDDRVISKDKAASALIDVCEECEELLVAAGRKYRLALSIDGNDVRALYNWGLALSFRAQLIADIGPEAAYDAEQVYLAAIDKFDGMMSKGNVYAPDALFRWGVVLQQRSRLRPANSKEKVKLLQQAKRLYEDALHMDSNNLQAKNALSSCVSELDYRLL